MHRLISILVGCLFVTGTFANNDKQNSIGFPEVEEDVNLKNKDNRQPLYLPSQCAVNELYYPGDQKDDWICDCRPAHLYHPNSESCWAAYERGPCAFGEYLVLPANSVIPVCVKNPCRTDTYVMWNGRCERLSTTTPCMHLYPRAAALGVNGTTLNVDCVFLNVETRFGEMKDPSVPMRCQPGSKLSISGNCSHVSQ